MIVASDPTAAFSTRLALARLHSAQSSDDPEAHFLLAITALEAAVDVSTPLAREASAALTDCAESAAPYERRDFTRRLGQLKIGYPHLTLLIAQLEHILIAEPSADHNG